MLLAVFAATSAPPRLFAQEANAPQVYQLSKPDLGLVDDLSRRSFRYFWDNMDPKTGLVLDRVTTDGSQDTPNHQDVASIAATGFGLTALSIGAAHRWVSPDLARERVVTTLRFFANEAPQKHGWFYHFLDAKTGKRVWHCEVSSIDTALLLAGVLTARQAFPDDPQINRLATLIYRRVDFPWMLNGDPLTLSHGWTPERGFIRYRWDTYSEAMILYALAIGSPTHPISPKSWYAWKLPIIGTKKYTYIGGGPLFIQQYSQAWLHLRNRTYTQVTPDQGFVPKVNYYDNAVLATRAQQLIGMNLSQKYPGYSQNIWGVTASDSSKGYVDWGALPHDSRIDGTVVPSAAAGSLMFAPDICIPALRAMIEHYGGKVYSRYGFADAFNPTTGWISHYNIGIDVGISLLSGENLRTGSVWQWFMNNPAIERALDEVGLVPKVLPLQLTAASVQPSSHKKNRHSKTAKSEPAPQPAPEIEVSAEHQIPASGFEYTIPITEHQVEYSKNLKFSEAQSVAVNRPVSGR